MSAVWMNEYLNEIEQQYGFSNEETKNIVMQTAEQFYTHKLRCPVSSEMSGGDLIIRRYSLNGFGSKENEITVKRSDIKKMSELLRINFTSYHMAAEYRYLKPYIGKAVQAVFLRYEQNDAVFFLENGEGSRYAGICSLRNIPEKERASYTPGQALWLIVIGFKDMNGVCFQLSRTAIRLVDELFRLQGSDVRCFKRIAGARSIVSAKERIPKPHIIFAANELKERIMVRY